MTIATLIDKFDTFELVRDQISLILVTEVASQMALAITAGKDPDLWKLRVFVERSNPFEQWLNSQTDRSPVVNIWYDTSTFDPSASSVINKQQTEGLFIIDCYGFGISQDVPGGGHVAGDKAAAINVQRAIRLVRNILMASEYTYLALRGTVGQRWPQSISVFQPQLDDSSAHKITGARITLRVIFNEFSPQTVPEILELVTVDVLRTEDGEIVLEADYPSS